LIKDSVATARLFPLGCQAISWIGASCQAASPETCLPLVILIAGRLSGSGVPASTKNKGVGVVVMVGVGVKVGVSVGIKVGTGVLVSVGTNVGEETGVGVLFGFIAWQAGKAIAKTPISIKRR
jgi:hypothetical protein